MSILVACDLTFRSEAPIRRAMQIGRDLDQPVEVVHVIDSSLPSDIRDRAMVWARQTLDRAVDAVAGESSRRPSVTVLAGSARAALISHANASGAELIVIGVHDTAKDGVFGFADTTAGHIVRASHVPVLLAKRPVEGRYKEILVDRPPSSGPG